MALCYCNIILISSIKDESKVLRDPTIEELRLYCRPKMAAKRSIGSNASVSSYTSNISMNSKISNSSKTGFNKLKAKEKGVVITVKKNESCPFSQAESPTKTTLQAKQEND